MVSPGVWNAVFAPRKYLPTGYDAVLAALGPAPF
jgi:hypothetical protein